MTQKDLTDKLNAASVMYYTQNKSPLSDIQFDLLFKQLQAMEKESGIVYPESPTQRVGSDIQEGFNKVEHPSPMLTIENTYSEDELTEWFAKAKQYNCDYNCSIKYDGISCELRYVNGVLYTASTRGNKTVGDDITENAKTIWTIPLRLTNEKILNGNFYVRGEIMLPKSKLEALNEDRRAKGEEPFANTRNACSGSIKQLNPKVTASRGLIFRAWDCFGDNIAFNTMSEKYAFLNVIGFIYENGTLPVVIESSSENLSQQVSDFKSLIDSLNLDYDYDGVVIKLEDVSIQNQIGTKDTRAIEWGIARKWNDDVAETDLIGVDWQVGRTGVLTPVARLNAVECCGVKVSNATLNNADFIKSFDLHIGNTITITRSGDVIPQVIGVTHDILMEVNGAYPKVEIPVVCPVCGMPLITDGKLLKCTNDKCPAIVEGKILQFCSKDCMDIKSVGEAMIHDLVYKCNISKFTELYTLRTNYITAEHLAECLGAGYGEKSCAKLLDAIDNSRNKPFENLLASLSIPGVGKVIARTLVKEFDSIEKLMDATVSELTTVDGVGGIMASDIYNYFHSTAGIQICKFFIENGFNTTAKIEETPGRLSGMIICFTGKSFRFAGDKIEEYFESNGAKCAHSVTGKTTYLITGEKPGASKVAKAQSLGVQILTEQEFYDKYNL